MKNVSKQKPGTALIQLACTYLLICCILTCTNAVYAQVKIGDFPNTISPNAMLEVVNGTDSTVVYNNGNFFTSGNAGIGIASPLSEMHISRTYTPVVGGIDGSSLLTLTNNGTPGSFAGMNIIGGSGALSFIEFGDEFGHERGGIYFDHTIDQMVLSTNGSSRIYISNDGRVGINQIPITGAPFHVKSVGSDYAAIQMGANGPMDYHITRQPNGDFAIFQGPFGGAAPRAFISNGINGWITPSDERLKKDIATLDSVLYKLRNVRGTTYTLRESGKQQIGVIAQDFLSVFPEVVVPMNDENGLYSVSYDGVAAIAIQGIKELDEKVDSLAARVQELETENTELKSLLEDTETRDIQSMIDSLRKELVELKAQLTPDAQTMVD